MKRHVRYAFGFLEGSKSADNCLSPIYAKNRYRDFRGRGSEFPKMDGVARRGAEGAMAGKVAPAVGNGALRGVSQGTCEFA